MATGTRLFSGHPFPQGETMPGYKKAWDDAKRTFEKESGQKKEKSPIFFGLFSKQGSGIGAALDKVEKAKTKKDFTAAWKKYQDTAKAYAKVVDPAIDEATKKEMEGDENARKVKKAYSNLWA